MSDSRHSVLVVHRQPAMQRLMAVALRLAGCEVIEAEDGREAAGIAGCRPVGLVVASVELPGMSGAELARELRSGASAGAGVILTSPYRPPERGAEDAFLAEPFAVDELILAARPFLVRPAAALPHSAVHAVVTALST